MDYTLEEIDKKITFYKNNNISILKQEFDKILKSIGQGEMTPHKARLLSELYSANIPQESRELLGKAMPSIEALANILIILAGKT